MRNGKLIVLEFNELTPRLMSQFIDEGVLPNFARLRQESATYLTDAGENPPNLEPWIQWVTAHCGVPFVQHQVFNLGDASRATIPPSRQGIGRSNETERWDEISEP